MVAATSLLPSSLLLSCVRIGLLNFSFRARQFQLMLEGRCSGLTDEAPICHQEEGPSILQLCSVGMNPWGGQVKQIDSAGISNRSVMFKYCHCSIAKWICEKCMFTLSCLSCRWLCNYCDGIISSWLQRIKHWSMAW
jgi:hypothetical protein